MDFVSMQCIGFGVSTICKLIMVGLVGQKLYLF